jgi:hypothetical protein
VGEVEYLDEAAQEHRSAGRSEWRALYRRVGNVFVIAAVGPEAQVSPRDMENLSDEGQ